MLCDEQLVDRVRPLISRRESFAEKKCMAARATCCGVWHRCAQHVHGTVRVQGTPVVLSETCRTDEQHGGTESASRCGADGS